MRVGQGTDVHAFGPGEFVMLGGVRIPHTRGVVAHSDGDVVLHALLAAGNFEQPAVERRIPVPWQASCVERLVEGAAMHLLGLGERAVHVEDQGVERHAVPLTPASCDGCARLPGTGQRGPG